MGFQYNGKLRAPELLLRQEDGSDGAEGDGGGASAAGPPPARVDVIRDRETLHCLYDNTHVPADVALRLARSLRAPGAREESRVPAASAPAWPYTGRPPAPPAATLTDAAKRE